MESFEKESYTGSKRGWVVDEGQQNVLLVFVTVAIIIIIINDDPRSNATKGKFLGKVKNIIGQAIYPVFCSLSPGLAVLQSVCLFLENCMLEH